MRDEWQGSYSQQDVTCDLVYAKCNKHLNQALLKLHKKCPKTSGLWEYGHGQQFVGSFKKCTASLVSNYSLRFLRLFYANSLQVPRPRSRDLDAEASVASFLKKS